MYLDVWDSINKYVKTVGRFGLKQFPPDRIESSRNLQLVLIKLKHLFLYIIIIILNSAIFINTLTTNSYGPCRLL